MFNAIGDTRLVPAGAKAGVCLPARTAAPAQRSPPLSCLNNTLRCCNVHKQLDRASSWLACTMITNFIWLWLCFFQLFLITSRRRYDFVQVLFRRVRPRLSPSSHSLHIHLLFGTLGTSCSRSKRIRIRFMFSTVIRNPHLAGS